MDNNNIKAYTPMDRKIIKYIKKHSNRNKSLTINNILKHLNLTQEEEIIKSIERLNNIYTIDIKENKLFLINTPVDRALPLEFDDDLNHFNSLSYYTEEVTSTNGFLKQLAKENKIKHGAILITEHQTDGRGQLNRVWEDKTFMSILMSTFLDLNINIEKVLLLSATVGLALSKTIKGHCSLNPQIKWPNDVYISGKKCAGILVEGSIMQTVLQHAIIGIGIDVNYELDDFPVNIRNLATSLRIETRIINNRMRLLNEFIKYLDKYITLLLDGKHEEIANKVNKILYHRGEVIIYKGDRYLVDSINPKGELVLSKIPGGEKLEISSTGDLEYAYGY